MDSAAQPLGLQGIVTGPLPPELSLSQYLCICSGPQIQPDDLLWPSSMKLRTVSVGSFSQGAQKQMLL